MRKTRVAVVILFALCPGVLLMPLKAAACRAVPYKPERLVADADVIVRVTALRYAKAPEGKYRTSGVPDAAVEFKVVEVLKGEGVPSSLTMSGYLDDRDDYNDRPVPYDFIRPGGRGGSCVANSYKEGAEFLLFLKEKEGGLTPYWAALSPTNEQLRPSEDAWLKWVKDSLRSDRRARHEVQGLSDLPLSNIYGWLPSPFMGARLGCINEGDSRSSSSSASRRSVFWRERARHHLRQSILVQTGDAPAITLCLNRLTII